MFESIVEVVVSTEGRTDASTEGRTKRMNLLGYHLLPRGTVPHLRMFISFCLTEMMFR